MERNQKWQVSVRELAEFVWQSGDLEVGRSGKTPSMRQGSEGHRWFQTRQGKNYVAEVPVSQQRVCDGIHLTIAGRADGVYEDRSPKVVEELKTTTESLMLLYKDRRKTHWAQARIYGAMLAMEYGFQEIEVRLTYIHIETLETRSFKEKFQAKSLVAFFDETVGKYLDWLRAVFSWRDKRNESLHRLSFPFAAARSGQESLMGAIPSAIANGQHLFVEAPTGAGKTIAVLYGALHSLRRGEVAQVVFATAKTVGGLSANHAVDLLNQSGARLKRVNLGARHRLCVHPSGKCTPECELTRGHYDRLIGARVATIESDSVSGELIGDIASETRVCPYWLAREMLPWLDLVVCDYNYLFDPRVGLKAFTLRGPRSVLVDEAHNLVDRAREMFGASLNTGAVQKLSTALPAEHSALKHRLRALHNRLRETVKQATRSPGPWPLLQMPPRELIQALERFIELAFAWLSNHPKAPWRESLEELFFEGHAFVRTANRMSDSDVTMVTGSGRSATVRILCLDPSERLREKLNAMKASAVFFSATLSPIEYFRRTLGGLTNDNTLLLPSPFRRENLKTLVAQYVSTRFKDRAGTSALVAKTILCAAKSHDGNYLVYFPSYTYLGEVAAHLPESSNKLEFAIQTQGFSDERKRDFLSKFSAPRQGSLVGLAVLGGLFGEGIDLVGDRLEGVIVVSPGLPKMGVRRELIRNHFERAGENGFKHAYLYPGMNRVVQAAGRLIRSETDTGTLILVGDRFARPDYAELLPSHWNPPVRLASLNALEEQLLRFWSMI